MAEQGVVFQSGGIELQGLIELGFGQKGVVVSHPHPLYGGDMRNNVVEAVVEAYREEGYSTLRFNLRGVGRSQGSYDDGRGEREDVKAAVAYLGQQGATDIDVAGYSFGAWVNASALSREPPGGRMILVAPPVKLYDFYMLGGDSRVQLVIAGSEDEFAPVDMVRGLVPTWNPKAELVVVQGADHFFWGRTGEVCDAIRSFIARS